MSDAGESDASALIPVFASVPSKLDERQDASKRFVYGVLAQVGLQPRTVGSTDRGLFNPLHEVRTLARHCAGGIVLGYHQISARMVLAKARERTTRRIVDVEIEEYFAPTPWNQLETGILFGLGLPLFVLRQNGITGGIFDEGASDVFVHEMPMPGRTWARRSGSDLRNPDVCRAFEEAVLRWQALVRCHYYGAG